MIKRRYAIVMTDKSVGDGVVGFSAHGKQIGDLIRVRSYLDESDGAIYWEEDLKTDPWPWAFNENELWLL